jgi:hypothetical protein
LRFPKKKEKRKKKNKEKKRKKERKKEKKNQKKGIVVPFVSSRAAHFVSSGVLCFPFVSRLASLARSRLGPAQYHR